MEQHRERHHITMCLGLSPQKYLQSLRLTGAKNGKHALCASQQALLSTLKTSEAGEINLPTLHPPTIVHRVVPVYITPLHTLRKAIINEQIYNKETN